jgi:hypothetical protein
LSSGIKKKDRTGYVNLDDLVNLQRLGYFIFGKLPNPPKDKIYMVGENEDETVFKTMNYQQIKAYKKEVKKAEKEIHLWGKRPPPSKTASMLEKELFFRLDDPAKPLSYSKVTDHVREIEFQNKEPFWQKYIPDEIKSPSNKDPIFVEGFPNPYFKKLAVNAKAQANRIQQLTANRVNKQFRDNYDDVKI